MKVFYKDEVAVNKLKDGLKEILTDDTIIVCIGTDRSIGDSLAPIVGSRLIEGGCKYKVLGTLENPIHALNIHECVNEINKSYSNENVLAIDACLGNSDSIGEIRIKNRSIRPGAGVGKKLPSVGNNSIVGIIDCMNEDNRFSFNNVRLNFVMKMAEVISESILSA